MAKPIEAIMQKEVTRKEFLALSGFGLASVFGFSSLIRLITGHDPLSSIRQKSQTSGYGGSAYGGSRDSGR